MHGPHAPGAATDTTRALGSPQVGGTIHAPSEQPDLTECIYCVGCECVNSAATIKAGGLLGSLPSSLPGAHTELAPTDPSAVSV